MAAARTAKQTLLLLSYPKSYPTPIPTPTLLLSYQNLCPNLPLLLNIPSIKPLQQTNPMFILHVLGDDDDEGGR